jgi:penicillin-binding protein 1C
MLNKLSFLKKIRWLLPMGVIGLTGLYLEAASRFEHSALAPVPGPLVLDRRGEILRLAPDSQGRKAVCLPPGPLPCAVAAAFVAAEDQRFWRHPGVDVMAVARALGQNMAAGRIVSGASTITQQLARLAYPGPRTYGRKLVEMGRSLRIEQALSKEEILRRYLNRVPLGYNLVGVESAALAYFGQPAAALTASQAALLAALAKAPSALRPSGPRHARLLARQRWVLGRMASLGLISSQELETARQEPLVLRGVGGDKPGFPFRAPHFVHLALARPEAQASPQGRVRTTLDLSLQGRVEAAVRSHQPRLLKSGASQAACVVVDNRTLGVLALVGSYHYGSRHQGFNNGAAALRSPGSALKPFLYAQALDQGFSPAAVLEDVERRYRTPWGEFLPANFDRSSHGPVPFREALGNSLNLSAVNLLNLVGFGGFYDTLKRLQLINHPERSADHYGLGLVVGNPEVSLLQLAAAYAGLANGGVFRNLRFLPTEPLDSGVRVYSPQAAFIVSDILADPLARSRVFGGSPAMNESHRLAVKTGTSTKYRDCWCVAYSPEYTVAVWVGNFQGGPTANLSGAVAAAPIVAEVVRELFKGMAPAAFPQPEGVTAALVCAFSGFLPGPGCAHLRREFFFTGTGPTQACTYHQTREPWHRLDAPYAGWLRQRYVQGGEGRFRLAGFAEDLATLFSDEEERGGGAPAHQSAGGRVPLGLCDSSRMGQTQIRFPAPEEGPLVTIQYPLNGDHFLLQPPAEELRLTVKAVCLAPFPKVAWVLNGQEVAASGPPYEVTLELGRGRHRLMAVGPDGRGDEVTLVVQ